MFYVSGLEYPPIPAYNEDLYMNDDISRPYILDETADFAVVFKPPRMHSAPLKKESGGGTLLDWYAALFPQVMDLAGRGEGAPSIDGGLLHRLDFETQGLMLFAKNQMSLDYFCALQGQGNFIKEYSAICHKSVPSNSSFSFPLRETPCLTPCNSVVNSSSCIIESYFRPFGPGRKQVRPVTDGGGKGKEVAKDQGGCYRTEIVNVIEHEYYEFVLRLKRGFRHQIRCHLAWIGCPVVNDPLYGLVSEEDGYLALRAHGLVFNDPKNGKTREYRIDVL